MALGAKIAAWESRHSGLSPLYPAQDSGIYTHTDFLTYTNVLLMSISGVLFTHKSQSIHNYQAELDKSTYEAGILNFLMQEKVVWRGMCMSGFVRREENRTRSCLETLDNTSPLKEGNFGG